MGVAARETVAPLNETATGFFASNAPSGSSSRKRLTPAPSGGLPIIVVQHPAQPLATPDRFTITSMGFIRDDQPIAETLVVSLAMIMRHEFVNPFAQRALAKKNHAL